MSKPKRLLRRLLLVVGAALFVAGAAILTVGLVGYFNDSVTPAPEEDSFTTGLDPSFGDLIPQPPKNIDEVENLPVAIPFYNPYPRVTVPLRMVVESIGVDAPVVELGLDSESIPQVPLNGQDVAWYDFSAKPGAGSNAVFAGHINWQRSPAVFADLDQVQPGDTIRLISDDGREYTYEVFDNFPVDPSDPASLKVMEPTSTDTITLITCGGTWIPDPSERFGGSYTDRTIVQARLVGSNLSLPAVPSAISDG